MPDPPVIVDDLPALELRPSAQPAVYDRDFELRPLYQDPVSGEEHYLCRYPGGLRARWHRHSAAHTLVLLRGQLWANGQLLGPLSYCHFPGGTPMHHAPAGDDGCLFLLIFHGPFDVEQLEEGPFSAGCADP